LPEAGPSRTRSRRWRSRISGAHLGRYRTACRHAGADYCARVIARRWAHGDHLTAGLRVRSLPGGLRRTSKVSRATRRDRAGADAATRVPAEGARRRVARDRGSTGNASASGLGSLPDDSACHNARAVREEVGTDRAIPAEPLRGELIFGMTGDLESRRSNEGIVERIQCLLRRDRVVRESPAVNSAAVRRVSGAQTKSAAPSARPSRNPIRPSTRFGCTIGTSPRMNDPIDADLISTTWLQDLPSISAKPL
jgi:hypothetical protein